MILTEKGFSEIEEILNIFFSYIKFIFTKQLIFLFIKKKKELLKRRELKKAFIRAFRKQANSNLVMKISLRFLNKLAFMLQI